MVDNTWHMIRVISVFKQIEQKRTKKGDKEGKKKEEMKESKTKKYKNDTENIKKTVFINFKERDVVVYVVYSPLSVYL